MPHTQTGEFSNPQNDDVVKADTMKRLDVLRELDEYIETAEKPLSEQDVADGWDLQHQQKAIEMFKNLRQALMDGKTAPKWSIVRTMDSWGVDGQLFERACALSNRLGEMKD